MTPAAEAMAKALAQTRDRGARKSPLVANVSAAALTDPDAIRESLVEQVTGTVRWRESVAFMAGAGGDALRRDRRRQGAGRPRQAHRRGRERDQRRDAGRCRGVQGGVEPVE